MIREHEYRSDYNGGPCTYRWYLTPCDRPREDHESVDYLTKQRDSAQPESRKRVELIVSIDLDTVPGPFHTKDSALYNLHGTLKSLIPYCNPTVELASEV